MIRNPHSFEAIIQYVEAHSSPAPSYLDELERETYLTMLNPQMVSGSHLGRFLSFISKLMRPRTIVEIGTFTGYATLCLWEGLADDGRIYTYEVNEETKWLYDKYVKKANAGGKINYQLGDALEHLDEIPTEIDLSWIDADKKLNPQFFEKVLSKTRKGGLIMIDNTLWSGKVLDEEKDPITQSIVDFSRQLLSDQRITCVMLPIRDGVTLITKL